MNRAFALVVPAVLLVGLLTYVAGLSLAGPAGRPAVLAGVALGCAVQLALFAVAGLLLQGKPMAAYGAGLATRFVVVVMSALVVAPAAGLAPAPFLLALVTVLFATTVLEPAVVAAGARKQR